VAQAGLPDGFFPNQKSKFGKILEGLGWEMLIYFRPIWNILWIFGIFYNHWVHFGFIWYIFPVLVSCTQKNLATLGSSQSLKTVEQLFFFQVVSIHRLIIRQISSGPHASLQQIVKLPTASATN
jgi:hypothetical protein